MENNLPAARLGIRTTEFWLALIVSVSGLLAARYSEHEWAQIVGMIGAALTSLGYGFVRMQVKRTGLVAEASLAEREAQRAAAK